MKFPKSHFSKGVLALLLILNSFSGFSQVQLGQDLSSLTAQTDNSNAQFVEISGDGATTVSYNGDYEILVHSWDGNAWIPKGNPIAIPSISYHYPPFVNINNNGTRIAISLPSGGTNVENRGYVRVYEWSGTQWNLMGIPLRKPNYQSNGSKMWALSISLSDDGQTLAITDPYYTYDTYSVVYFYKWDGTNWVVFSSIEHELDHLFGKKVSLSADGTKVAISAPQIQNGSPIVTGTGAVYYYELSGNTWNLVGNPILGDNRAYREGEDIELSGDGSTIISDSRYTFTNSGSNFENKGIVRVFEFNGTDWIQKGQELKLGTICHFTWTENNSVAVNYDGSKIIIGTGPFGYTKDVNFERQYTQKIDYYTWENNQWTPYGFDSFLPDKDHEIGVQVAMTRKGDTIVTQGRTFSSRNAFNSSFAKVYRWCYSLEQLSDTLGCDSLTLGNGVTYKKDTAGVTFNEEVNFCLITRNYNIIINSSKTNTDIIESCEPIVWIDGITYSNSNNTAKHTLQTKFGCDSVVSLDLTVNRVFATDKIDACEKYTWINGIEYTSSTNAPKDTLTSYNGCDSVVTLDLTIFEKTEYTDVIVACDDYTWIDGVKYETSQSATGPTPVRKTLVNAAGCDSVVTLDLTINKSNSAIDVKQVCASLTWIDGNTYTSSVSPTDANPVTHTTTNKAGCDSLITLDLTILNNSGEDVISSCDSYTWLDGITYTEDNFTATHTLTNAAGCDSIVSLKLSLNKSSSYTDIITSCEPYTWLDGNTYPTNNNTATHTIPNNVGCDSVITLNLTVFTDVSSIDTQSACDSYTWIDGKTYATTVSPSDPSPVSVTLNNTAGCDSVVYLDLTISQSTAGIDVIAACEKHTWIDGNEYTSSISATDPNPVQFTLQNEAGCDSVVSLDLTILKATTGIDQISACENYTWIDGITYTATPWVSSGDPAPTFTLANQAGCDSVVTLDLTILKETSGIDIKSACASYTWLDGNTYTTTINGPGAPTHTLTNEAGCDSVVTLNLSILNNAGTDTQFACKSLVWIDGVTYTSNNTTATHTLTNKNGCDSVVTLNLTIGNNTGTDIISACDSYTWIDGNTYTVNNNTATYLLTNSQGCDSVVTLNLSLGKSNTGVDVVKACDSYTWIDGIEYTSNNSTATHVLTNQAGCDSTVTLNLSLENSSVFTDVHSSCAPFVWIDGNSYSTSRPATGPNPTQFTLQNTQGCDSVVTLDLTILNSSFTDVVHSCDAFTWIDGNTYSANISGTGAPTYTLTNAAGCDSVITLELSILSNTGTDVIQACDSYLWIDGITYQASNNTAQHTLTNAAGCDSVVTLQLSLTQSGHFPDVISACDSYTWIDGITYTSSNNQAEFTLIDQFGCDSILDLDLQILNSTQGIDIIQSCGPYTWINGITYTATPPVGSGKPTFTLNNAVGCDSLIELDLKIFQSSTGVDDIVACNDYTWIDGVTYTVSNNTATFTLSNSHGCDSLVTLNLDLSYDTQEAISAASCDSYYWDFSDTTYFQSGVFSHTVPSSAGCDSSKTLNLEINSSKNTSLQQTACESYFWDATGISYSQSGNYTWNGLSADNCDSIVELALTIFLNDTITNNTQACDSYFWPLNGVNYTSSGNYEEQIPNATGCFDVHQLNLIIDQSTTQISTENSCDSYYWDVTDSTYLLSTQETIQFSTAQGCDSIRILDLTIFHSDSTFTALTACDSVFWETGDRWLNTSGRYSQMEQTKHGCDSIIYVDLNLFHSTIRRIDTLFCGETYFWDYDNSSLNLSGTYSSQKTNSLGCDSTEVLTLVLDPIGNAEILVEGSYLQIKAEMWDQIQWEFCPLGGDCVPIATGETRIETLDNGIYRATLEYQSCSSIIEVAIENYSCASPYYVPNTFTPDFDELNDFFSIVDKACPVTEFKFSLYDRWGSLIFESNDPKFKWDGTKHGFPVKPGVYSYVLVYSSEGFELNRGREIGSLTLLK